jgi:hypothetical protein
MSGRSGLLCVVAAPIVDVRDEHSWTWCDDWHWLDLRQLRCVDGLPPKQCTRMEMEQQVSPLLPITPEERARVLRENELKIDDCNRLQS